MVSRFLENNILRALEAKRTWLQVIKKPRVQDFSRDWFPDFKTSWSPGIKNSWGPEFLTSGAHESKSSWFRDIRGSWLLDIKMPRLQSVLISWHHYFMMDWVQDLFIPFQGCFVPDVGFGNGLFASSDWPANKRKRDVMFDPFLEVRNIICFDLGKLCFPLREIDFVTENSLPARGWRTPPKSSFFYRAPRVPRSDFNHRRVFDTLRSKMDTMQGIIASYGQKKRSIYRQNRPFNWPWSVLYSTEFLLTRTIFWKRLKSIFHKKRSRCVKSVICD